MEENDKAQNDKVVITQPIGDKFMQHELVTVGDTEKLQLFKCPKDGHIHFRHAGYVLAMVPFTSRGESKLAQENISVMICVKCKSAFVFMHDKLNEITDYIDLNAWEKTEKEAHEATGPGGQC